MNTSPISERPVADDATLCTVLIVQTRSSWKPNTTADRPSGADIVGIAGESFSGITFGSAKAFCRGFNSGEMESPEGYWAYAT